MNSKIKRLRKEISGKRATFEQIELKVKETNSVKRYLNSHDRIEQYNAIKSSIFEKKAMKYAV